LNGQNSFGRDLIELGVFRTAGKPDKIYSYVSGSMPVISETVGKRVAKR
jgi:hypothetical protein